LHFVVAKCKHSEHKISWYRRPLLAENGYLLSE